jgi:integrase
MGHKRLHDARHTAATLLLAQDVPVKVVSEILGHARTDQEWSAMVMRAPAAYVVLGMWLARQDVSFREKSACFGWNYTQDVRHKRALIRTVRRAPFCAYSIGGDVGTRTPDPHTASVMLSQLSYTPAWPRLAPELPNIIRDRSTTVKP